MLESLFLSRSPRDWLARCTCSLIPKIMQKWLNMVDWNWEKRYLNWGLEKVGQETIHTEDIFKLCSGLQWVKVDLKIELEKYTDLDCPVLLENWSQEFRGKLGGKEDVSRALSLFLGWWKKSLAELLTGFWAWGMPTKKKRSKNLSWLLFFSTGKTSSLPLLLFFPEPELLYLFPRITCHHLKK